jgi:hypothetical protein
MAVEAAYKANFFAEQGVGENRGAELTWGQKRQWNHLDNYDRHQKSSFWS